jgi:hypothetical protein
MMTNAGGDRHDDSCFTTTTAQSLLCVPSQSLAVLDSRNGRGLTALHLAASVSNDLMAEKLLAAGASPPNYFLSLYTFFKLPSPPRIPNTSPTPPFCTHILLTFPSPRHHRPAQDLIPIITPSSLVCWSVGVLGSWVAGVLVCLCGCVLACWCVGVLVGLRV